MDGLYIRRATMEDMDLIFQWANDEEERKNSFHSEMIPYETHCIWYKSRMESEDTFIYILMCEDIPVGQCRLKTEGKEALISYSVDKAHRNKGYGKKLLTLVYEEVKRTLPDISEFVAEVKEENVPSQKVFSALGYTEKADTQKAIREYRLIIE